MTIVVSHYRPKRAPRKRRKQPAMGCRIVTAAKPKPKYSGPLIVTPSMTRKQVKFLAWARAHAVKAEE